LSQIIYENDLEVFHQKINQFIVDYASQVELIGYLKKNWFFEDIMKVWSRAYHENQFSHMYFRNCIKTTHNQLKTVFLGRARNRRLNKLVFVLVEEVEYFLRQESDRILGNNGAMTKYQKMQRVREMEAEKLTADEVSAMISRSFGHFEDKCGEWQVLSFSEEEVVYSVVVNGDLLVVSCSCLDFEHRRRP
ncbi:hypothetical protein BD560DRAFT_308886, partial [Blakeslea trispora]